MNEVTRRSRCTAMTLMSEKDRDRLLQQSNNIIDLRKSLMIAKLYRRGLIIEAEKYAK